jgi:rod shape determining protein RodA
MNIALHFKKLDWLLIFSSLALALIGLFLIYQLSYPDFSDFQKQAIFIGVGFLLMIALSFFDPRWLKENSSVILGLYILCLIMLVLLFFFAPEIRGTKSWFKIGSLSFDPIEPTKIVLIILLSKYFSRRHLELNQGKHIVLSGIYTFLPAALVFLQPNFGSAILLLVIWFGILFISGINLRNFVLIALILALILGVGWFYFLEDYQKDRITSFLFPENDVKGLNWNQTQAKIAIGSGGLFGRGSEITQAKYGFLPEAKTDFIFAAFAERFGFVGILVLMALFIILFFRILKIALDADSNFARLFASGFLILIFVQFFINVAVNLGLLPVIGISLPFVSYGGSNLVFNFIAIGILQSFKTH